MILVIDDLKRFDNKNFLFDKDFLGEGIIFLDKVTCGENLSDFLLHFPNLKCICFHASYLLLNNKLLKNMIFETILSSNKDFYIAEFSGGLETNLVNERYAKIEVKEFYGNLMYFYKSFKKTQIINLAVLTYGKNYKVFIILRLYEKLKEMFFLNSFQALNVENIIPLIQEEINIDELKEDKEKVISWIMKSKSIDKNDVIYIVERWIARYL